MTETVLLIVAAFIIAGLYKRTEHPVLYAFAGMTAGVLTLLGLEMLLGGSLAGVDICSAALSVMLGVPGTLLHLLLRMI